MLRTNLSTRPFYNERAVHWALGLAAVALVALTVFNVHKVLTLTHEQARFNEDIQRDEARAQTLTAQAARVRASIDQASLERVIKAAREANVVIDERTFSWTELFNHIEGTLPANVMLTAVQPRVEPEGVTVAMTVIGREVENVDEFIENLEKTGVFSNVLANAEQVTEEGTVQVTLTGNYRPSPLKLVPSKPVETEGKADESKAGEDQAGDAKPVEGTSGDGKGGASKPGASQPSGQKAGGKKPLQEGA